MLLAMVLTGCMTDVVTNSALERNKNPEKAISSYVAAGMFYLKSGDLAMADRKLRKAYELSPSSPEVNNALALLYSIEGEPDEVEQFYRDAIKFRPDYSAARNNYASFLYKQGRFSEAKEQLFVVIKDYAYVKRHQSLESLGYCYLSLKDKKKAETYFLKAIKRNPKMGRSMLELAEIYFDQKKYKLSEHYLSQFDKISAPTPRQLWLGVRLQRMLGDEHKLASFELALKNLFPDSHQYDVYKESLQ